MSTQLLHGQMSVVDENGNVTILHQETSASDVLVNKDTNTHGADGGSSIPVDVDTLQKLTDKMGDLAFKSKVESADLADGVVVNNYTTTEEGHVLDARAGTDLNERVKTIEESEYVYIEDSEDGEVVLPESEINDDITSETLTWSSSKITTEMTDNYNELKGLIDALDLSQNFYIPLLKNSSNNYVAQKTVAEIEAAYQKGKALWAIASDILVPLSKRIDENNWIFSGYTSTQGYDITVSNTGVTVIYKEILTRDVIQGLETEYNETTETIVFK